MVQSDFPKRPFFDCGAESFDVYDAQQAAEFMRGGSAEPWLSIRCGSGNIFESKPQRVVKQQGLVVSVACADGSVVHLDFGSGVVLKETGGTVFRYRGDVQEGNFGRGYMRER